MTDQQDEPILGPEDAMNRALAAERQAEEAIRLCREAAEQRIAETRNRARRIAECTDARISRLHERCAAASKQEAQQRVAEERQLKSSITLQVQADLLEAAVTRLAEKLTTAERQEQD